MPAEADLGTQRRLTLMLQKAALRARKVRRRERDGEEIELDDAVHAALALRSASAGEPRVYRRVLRAPERCAVLLLIDSSASSAHAHADDTQLVTQQRAATLLAGAAAAAGWSLAIQGFDSDGRQGVNHWRVK
ncbi:MAG: hypothetical protein EOP76_20595, partial [Variovorax sp.]